MLKEGIKTRSACWRKEYRKEVHAYASCFYLSFSLYFLFLFLPSACSSCFLSVLQHVLLVFFPSFSMHFLFLFIRSIHRRTD
jgi:hypothetical protein